MKSKTETKFPRLDPKDAMAAMLAGCNGISDKQARRRIDWILACGSEEQRKSIEATMDAVQRAAPPGYEGADAETQLRVLRIIGKMLAAKYRRQGKRPPCDDPIARSKMLRIARFFFSPKKIEKVFTPLVGHYAEELDDARGSGLLKVLLVKVEWWCHFAKACGFDKWLVLVELASKIVKLVL